MTQYPVGGPREPVYALMRKLGHSADGITVSIFGAGSMARIQFDDEPIGECELDKLSERIDWLRGKK